MANTLLTREEVTYEGLRLFKNMLGYTSRVKRTYDDRFAKKGAKIGDTLNVRKPPMYQGRRGEALQPEATTETSVPVIVDTLWGVDTEFSNVERTLSLDNYADRVLKPKINTLINMVDIDGANLTKKIYNAVGTPGTRPTDHETYLNAAARLTDFNAPDDDERYGSLTPWGKAKLVKAGLPLFNPQADISKAYRRGEIGMMGGVDWFETQNVYTHVNGTYVPSGAALEVKGANQSGATLLIDGYTSASHKEGDVFTIEGVYSVNAITKQSTGNLKQFRVSSDIAYVATDVTLPIDPPIVLSGPTQNVSNAPADNADITFHASTGRTYKEMLAFHRDWATLVVVDQETVEGYGAESITVRDEDAGISMRSTTAYDIQTNKVYNRLEVLGGWAVLYPEWAVRISTDF
jgi:hypothetical protein